MSTIRELKIDEFTYPIGGLVMVARRWEGCTRATWYLKCPFCGQRHIFRKLGTALWHTSCDDHKTEWTITPKEYHTSQEADFTKVLGDV